jgi:hypothetical protein
MFHKETDVLPASELKKFSHMFVNLINKMTRGETLNENQNKLLTMFREISVDIPLSGNIWTSYHLQYIEDRSNKLDDDIENLKRIQSKPPSRKRKRQDKGIVFVN